jgi:hypothetical protein
MGTIEPSVRLPSMSDLYQENGCCVHYFFNFGEGPPPLSLLVREAATRPSLRLRERFPNAELWRILRPTEGFLT